MPPLHVLGCIPPFSGNGSCHFSELLHPKQEPLHSKHLWDILWVVFVVDVVGGGAAADVVAGICAANGISLFKRTPIIDGESQQLFVIKTVAMH